jgi:hypothetical protein
LSVVYSVRDQFYDAFEDLRLCSVEWRVKRKVVPLDTKKARRRSSCIVPLILTSALGRGEWSNSRPGFFIPEKFAVTR